MSTRTLLMSTALVTILAGCGATRAGSTATAPPPFIALIAEEGVPAPLASVAGGRSPALVIAEIAQFERLLTATGGNSPERPLLLRRIAEDYHVLEMATVKATATLRPQVSWDAVRIGRIGASARKGAIHAYATLAREYPAHCLRGESEADCGLDVLVYLAEAYERDGREADAQRIYEQIHQRWPASTRGRGGDVSRAERLFDESEREPRKLPEAETAYARAASSAREDDPVRGYLFYKLAFVHWNQRDTKRALEDFERAAAHAEAHPSSTAEKLIAAVRRDYVAVFAQGGDPREAAQALGRISFGDEAVWRTAMDALFDRYVAGDALEAAAVLLRDRAETRSPAVCKELNRLDAAMAKASRGTSAARALLHAEGQTIATLRTWCAGTR